MILILMTQRINGYIAGVLISLPLQRFTESSLATLCSTQFIDGFGKAIVSQSIKSFFWLLIKDRLSTRNILRRRGMDLDSYSCVFCNSLVEGTLEHLFVNCPFSIMCWNVINVSIPIQSSSPEIFSQIKDQLASPFAMDAIILLSWSI